MKTGLCVCLFGLSLMVVGCATTNRNGVNTYVASGPGDFYVPSDNPPEAISGDLNAPEVYNTRAEPDEIPIDTSSQQ